MQDLISPIKREILLAELSEEIFVRKTNKGDNEIYIFRGIHKPNLMNEVARLREVSFRAAGGGTGKSSDQDLYDLKANGYQQLIVWNPEDQAIVGGYRFVFCRDTVNANQEYDLSTTEILHFSETIKQHYFPYTIELGRSFVQPDYQPSQGSRNGIFSLDNLWDGLGALIVDNPEMKYFFGKITMYPSFNQEARNLILDFMDIFFPDKEALVKPVSPIERRPLDVEFYNQIKDLPYKQAYNHLSKLVRNLGENIPPLFNSYMSLSPTMKTFGTSVNSYFGGVEETGIMVTIDDIYTEKKERHVQSYIDQKNENQEA
jgi:hypothetical protein